MSSPADQVMYLQRTIGNQAVQRLIKSGALQAKLKIGQPGDKYEQEADRVADAVMRMSEPQVRRQPIEEEEEEQIQAKPVTEQITPLVQRQVEEEEEEQVQTKPVTEQITPLVQRQVEEEEEEQVQTKPVSEQITPLVQKQVEEEEEEQVQTKSVTEQITPLVQRQVEEEEEELLQTKRLGSQSNENKPSLTTRIQSMKGGGHPIPESTRRFFEQRFGNDFNEVRVHTNKRAAYLVNSVSAQAFTVGNDIFFNPDRYNPDSIYGRNLLAHELVHTLQQNPKKHANKNKEQKINNNEIQSNKLQPYLTGSGFQESLLLKSPQTPGVINIQRLHTFAPYYRPKGTTIHSRVLPMFVKSNKDLFIEVKIPGAIKGVKDIERAGIADFYKAIKTDGISRTIGIRIKDGKFKFLKKDSKLEWSGEEYSHNKEAAPVGYKYSKKEVCDRRKAKVCKLDKAPTHVYLGDLKPGGSAEANLGVGQLKDYFGGIELTKNAVNKFIASDPDKVHPRAKKWNIIPTIIGKLAIPDELKYPGGKGILENKLSAYEGNRKKVPDSGLTGSLYVYKDKANPGIWSYEWFPSKMPKSSGSELVRKALDRLNKDVIGDLKKAPKGFGQKKYDPLSPRSTGRNLPVRSHSLLLNNTIPIGIQRGGFKVNTWKTKFFKPWKKKAKAILRNKRKLGKAPVAVALVELDKRSPSNLGLSKEIIKIGKGLPKIRHWIKWGGLYGRLRGVFGTIFTKISGFYNKMKQRFKKIFDKSKKPGISASGIMGAVTRVAFSAAIQFFQIISRKVVVNLKSALKKGAEMMIRDFFSDKQTEEFTENIEKIKSLFKDLNKFKKEADEKFDKALNKLMKPYEDQFKFLSKVKDGLKLIGNIVSIVKWGARVIHCATPPLLGCLKLILQSLTEKAIKLVVKTCWFQKKVIVPMFNTFSYFKELPQTISNSILNFMRDFIPLPDSVKSSLFPEIRAPPSSLKEGEIPCDKDKITKEQRALNKLYDKYGKDKFELLKAILEEARLGDKKRKITMADIPLFEEALKLSKGQLEEGLKKARMKKGTGIQQLDGLIEDLKEIKEVSGEAQKPEKEVPSKVGEPEVEIKGEKEKVEEKRTKKVTVIDNESPEGVLIYERKVGTAKVIGGVGFSDYNGSNIRIRFYFDFAKEAVIVKNVKANVKARIYVRNDSTKDKIFYTKQRANAIGMEFRLKLLEKAYVKHMNAGVAEGTVVKYILLFK